MPKAKTTAAVRKTPAKTAVKKVALKAKAVRVKKVKVPRQTKSAFLVDLAERTGTDRKTASLFLTELGAMMVAAVGKKGPGVFTLPGLLKVTTRVVPARKGGAMVLNRFTGAMVKQKAKAASVRLKVRPLTGLKASV